MLGSSACGIAAGDDCQEICHIASEQFCAKRQRACLPSGYSPWFGQPAQFAVEAGNAVIVNQQTDPYTPRCRSAQVFQQEITGQIVAPDVILQVDRSFGRGDESRADGKRVYAVLDKCNARQAGMAHRVLSDTQADCGKCRISERMRSCALYHERRVPVAHPRYGALSGGVVCDGTAGPMSGSVPVSATDLLHSFLVISRSRVGSVTTARPEVWPRIPMRPQGPGWSPPSACGSVTACKTRKVPCSASRHASSTRTPLRRQQLVPGQAA